MKKLLLAAMLVSLTMPVFAKLPTAQRSCVYDDLSFGNGGSAQTSCVWTKNKRDSAMSITLLSQQVPAKIDAICIFVPVKGSTDSVTNVVGKKAAEWGIKDFVNNNNVITFKVENKQGTEKNANLLFELNKDDNNYAVGDILTCSFSASSK